MNNVGYALLHNFFFFFGLIYYLKYEDAWIGFGIIAVGIGFCYGLDDIVRIVSFIKNWRLLIIKKEDNIK